MDDKNNKPVLRFQEFNDSWAKTSLGSEIEISSASRVHKNEWKTSGVPFFRSSDVVAEFIGTNNNKAFISLELYEDLSSKSGKVEKNDILVTGGGSIGIPYLIKSNAPLYFKDADLLWLKNSDKINGYFLYSFFSTDSFKKYVKSITHIGTISHYTIEQARSTPIILPERAEQDKIGNFIHSLDNLINLHQKKYDKLVILKKAMLSKMFPKVGESVPEIRFQNFNVNWTEKSLGDLGNPYTGLSGKNKDDFGHGKGRYITYMNVFTHSVSNKNLTEPIEIDNNQNQVKFGDVFFTTSSEVSEEVGMSSVWMERSENVYLNSFCFGYRPLIDIDSYFLAYLFRSTTFRKKIIFLAQGISRYNISKTQVMKIDVSLPVLEEQQKIGIYFKNLDKLISLNKSELDNLKNIKKACLEKMFV